MSHSCISLSRTLPSGTQQRLLCPCINYAVRRRAKMSLCCISLSRTLPSSTQQRLLSLFIIFCSEVKESGVTLAALA
eukprot:scaffold101539_cov19-Tisochrysis_lutea.AAC.2